jgi:nicotinamide-nucleotide adenylyltransferase
VVCVTTRLYDWNDEKIRRLTNEGYRIHVLEECQKVAFDGCRIRSLIRSGDASWKAMVNPAVAHLIDQWEIRPRLERLAADETRDT